MMKCRHCASPLRLPFLDLGSAPPSNAYLTEPALHAPETCFPLRVLVCTQCWLVQTEDFAAASELFTANYAYFSSVSASFVDHARRYVAEMIERFRLDANSFVVEIASNDGYLLQFVRDAGIPRLGVEPTSSTAAAARERGIETLEAFFSEELGERLALERRPADLIAANNVLAHVPDINDFVAGFRGLLAPEGVATFEFPHLLQLIEDCQFDTIYHEHYSYLSLQAVSTIFEAKGLRVFDVEQLPTHGGSLRVFACREDARTRVKSRRVDELLANELKVGIKTEAYYAGLQSRAEQVKLDLLAFLVEQKRAGRSVAAYGAAAKGNTLLNYAGVKPDLLPYVCDAAPSKQGKFLPGSHIPILAPAVLRERKPDYVLILPWNLRAEVTAQLDYARAWGARFVTAVPTLQVTP